MEDREFPSCSVALLPIGCLQQRRLILLLKDQMAGSDCFPPWLKRRTIQDIGPQIEDAIPYPVYQIQPTILDAQNPNSPSFNVGEAANANFSGQFTPAQLPNRIVHVMPRNAYDTIYILAFDSNPTVASAVLIPIFLSFNAPSRPVGATPLTEVLLQGNQEIGIITCNTFVATSGAGANLSVNSNDFPAMTGFQSYIPPSPATVVPYSFMQFDAQKTNRPFWAWFNDGLSAVPGAAGAGNFKISWYVRGR